MSKSRRCYVCEAGGDRMATVTLSHLPPGWVAFACAKGNAGHIGPAALAPPDRKRLAPGRKLSGAARNGGQSRERCSIGGRKLSEPQTPEAT